MRTLKSNTKLVKRVRKQWKALVPNFKQAIMDADDFFDDVLADEVIADFEERIEQYLSPIAFECEQFTIDDILNRLTMRRVGFSTQLCDDGRYVVHTNGYVVESHVSSGSFVVYLQQDWSEDYDGDYVFASDSPWEVFDYVTKSWEEE